MARVKTFTNGGSLLPGDLNSIQDDYESAFAMYKPVARRSSFLAGGSAAATYLLGTDKVAVSTLDIQASLTASVPFYLDPTDHAAAARSTFLRMRASLFVNATAPGSTITVGLYPVTAVAGASGAMTLTLGTLVAGSSVAFATPAASATLSAASSDFAAPAAGVFVLAAATSGSAQAAASTVHVAAALQARQV